MKKLTYILLIISVGFFISSLVISHSICQDYISASNKSKALFGITLTIKYGYRLNIGIITSILVLISLLTILKNKKAKLNYYMFIINLLSSIVLLTNLWRIFV